MHFPMTISLSASRPLLLAAIAWHALGLVAVWETRLDPTAKSILSMAIAASLILIWVKHHKQRRLRFTHDGQLSLWSHNAWHPVARASISLMWPSLVVLKLFITGRRFPLPLLITHGHLSDEAFRQLRVCLRWLPGRDMRPHAANHATQ